MANLLRYAKSGNDWTLNDLNSYHISLNQVDALTFFGLEVTRSNFTPILERDSYNFEYCRSYQSPRSILSC